MKGGNEVNSELHRHCYQIAQDVPIYLLITFIERDVAAALSVSTVLFRVLKRFHFLNVMHTPFSPDSPAPFGPDLGSAHFEFSPYCVLWILQQPNPRNLMVLPSPIKMPLLCGSDSESEAKLSPAHNGFLQAES